MLWVIDGNNVMGAGADGWWNDPPAAATRLAQQVAQWCRAHDDSVILTFDGKPVDSVEVLAGGNLEVRFAPRRKPDAADDLIVEIVEDVYASEPEIHVVTSDKGLLARLPPGVDTSAAGWFRRGPLGLAR
ncbi:MAG: NYN domain-containing protein [Actinomycetia bacterium]|nr:NYN domain-containing protein [Actinomycetes bacterium]